jgi:hypothetical protein
MNHFIKHTLLALALVGGACFLASETFAQQQAATKASAVSATGAPVDADRIIRSFTAKETQFRNALNQYSFKRDAVIQTIGQGGQISGEYHRVSTFTFDDSGNRYEKIGFFPMPTLTEINVTIEDLEDLGGVNQFALEASKINQYNFTYAGKERLDELNTYVFDVAPKITPDPKKSKERFFKGRIWVDDQDLQIVKARGKGVPEGKNDRYPSFEIYREHIDGKYWFPTYSYADEELAFPSGQTVHLRALVRYTDFVRGSGKLRIIDDDEIVNKPSPAKPSPTPVKPTKP